MAYKFQLGAATLSGSTTFEEDLASDGSVTGGSVVSTSTVSGSGALQGASVAVDGAVAAGSLTVDDGSTIGTDSDTDMLTLTNGDNITVASDVALVLTDGKLVFGSTAVTSTAAELNLLDTAAAGTVVNSKAVIYAADGQINGGVISGSGALQGASVAVDGAVAAGSLTGSGAIAGASIQVGGGTAVTNLSGDGLVIGSNTLSVAVSGAMVIASDKVGLSGSIAGQGLTFLGGVNSISNLTVDISTNGGITKTAGLTSDEMALDINDLAAATVDVAADSIAIVDSNDANKSKKESIADLVSAIAGAGLAASSGVLSTAGNAVALKADGDTLATGVNYFASASANATVSLPGSPSVGDRVIAKAAELGGGSKVIIQRQGSHVIDDDQTQIEIESPFGAVTLVYVVANEWRII
jgi:hypothetical protein